MNVAHRSGWFALGPQKTQYPCWCGPTEPTGPTFQLIEEKRGENDAAAPGTSFPQRRAAGLRNIGPVGPVGPRHARVPKSRRMNAEHGE